MALPLLAGVASAALSKPSPATMPDGPIDTTSGATFQGGSLVVGSKQVGGKGNTAGATTATAAQTATEPRAGSSVLASIPGALPVWMPWALVGAALLLALAFLGPRKK
jgi:hypothetical protein